MKCLKPLAVRIRPSGRMFDTSALYICGRTKTAEFNISYKPPFFVFFCSTSTHNKLAWAVMSALIRVEIRWTGQECEVAALLLFGISNLSHFSFFFSFQGPNIELLWLRWRKFYVTPSNMFGYSDHKNERVQTLWLTAVSSNARSLPPLPALVILKLVFPCFTGLPTGTEVPSGGREADPVLERSAHLDGEDGFGPG